jgi:hypothetical protein
VPATKAPPILCYSCAAKLKKADKFCPDCGEKVDSQVALKVSTEPDVNVSPLAQMSSSQKVLTGVLFVVVFGLAWYFNGPSLNFESNSSSQTVIPTSESQPEDEEKLSLSLVDSYVECSSGWCSLFSVEITNNGTTPVDVFEEMCLVAGGKTYSENFGDYLSDTVNPGQTKLFDANFRFDASATATELFIGNCSSNTKIASVRIPG